MVDGDLRTGPARGSAPSGPVLAHAVADLYADLRLTPTLHTLLTESRRLVDAAAGSISVVDPDAATYRKLAERGVACRLGQVFPLDEGATGQAVARRRPVVIDDYASLTRGHLPSGHPASRGSALAVPIWWRGEVIAVNVTFAGRRRRFSTAEIDALEVLTQSAAGALVTAGRDEPSLARVIRDHARADDDPPGSRRVVTEVGAVGPVPREVAEAAVDLVLDADAAAGADGVVPRLHVALVHRGGALTLLVQQEAPGAGARGPATPGAWRALRAVRDGAAAVAEVPGWGSVLRADLPFPGTADPARDGNGRGDRDDEGRDGTPTPLTAREREVLALLARGLGDRAIAERLVLSRRTVEKHVAAVLRKTGTGARTAAVVRALELGWLPAPGHA